MSFASVGQKILVVLVLVVLFLLNACSKQAGGPTVPMIPVLPDTR